MSTKNLSGECQQCGGRFEFPAEAAGLTGECPHCSRQTACLLAALPEERSPVQTRAVIFTVVAILILVGGLVGAITALKRAQRLYGQKRQAQTQTSARNPSSPSVPFAAEGFRVSAVTLAITPGTKLVHAQGSIVNTANRQRFGVRVELDLFDAAGRWLAKASDDKNVIEPNAEWKFSALVVETKAASAKITAIKETK